MSRTTDFHVLQSRNQDNHLKIKSFYVRFTSYKHNNKSVPESLTLVYLPRVNGTRDIVIDGSSIPPESKVILGLHIIVNVRKQEAGEFTFGSRERVLLSEGVRFEVYLSEERVLDGTFRKDDDIMGKWRLDCGSGGCGGEKAAVEVCVEVEGHGTLNQRVVKRKRKSWRGCGKLEVIPEEEEAVADRKSEGKCCCFCEELIEENGPDCKKVEKDLEAVSWAIDVGIWVVCLGMGYMVSKVSAQSLRRLRLL